MEELGLHPNEETMHQLMTAYANVGDVVGTDEVLSRYENMGFIPTATTMSLILSSILNNPGNFDPKIFHSCYTEYFDINGDNNKLIPNSLTYTQLLLAASMDESIDFTLMKYKELLDSRFKPSMFQKQIVKVIVGSDEFQEYFGTKKLKKLKDLNNVVFIKNDDKEKSKLIHDKMKIKLNEVIPTTDTINSNATTATNNDDNKEENESINISESLKSYAMKGDVMNIKKILAEERKSGIHPDLYTMNALIYAYCYNGDIMNARKIISKMQENESRLKPDEKTMKILMQELAVRGNPRGVEELFQEMINMGLKPGAVYRVLYGVLCCVLLCWVFYMVLCCVGYCIRCCVVLCCVLYMNVLFVVVYNYKKQNDL